MRKFIAGFVRTVTHKRIPTNYVEEVVMKRIGYMLVVIGVLTGGLIWKFQQIRYKEIASTILLTAE